MGKRVEVVSSSGCIVIGTARNVSFQVERKEERVMKLD